MTAIPTIEKENNGNLKVSVFEMTKDLMETEDNEAPKGVDWGWGDETNNNGAEVTKDLSDATVEKDGDAEEREETWKNNLPPTAMSTSPTVAPVKEILVITSSSKIESEPSTLDLKTERFPSQLSASTPISKKLVLHESVEEDTNNVVDLKEDKEKELLKNDDSSTTIENSTEKKDSTSSSPTKENDVIEDTATTTPSSPRRSTRAQKKPAQIRHEESTAPKVCRNPKKIPKSTSEGEDDADDEAEAPSLAKQVPIPAGEQPDEEDLLRSTDFLFLGANQDTVTVADICRALCAEYDCKLSKDNKKRVRDHLIDLMKGNIVPQVTDPSQDQVSEQGDLESEASDLEDSNTDEEYEAAQPKRSNKAKSKSMAPPKHKHSDLHKKKHYDDEQREDDHVSGQVDPESDQSEFEQADESDEDDEAAKSRRSKKLDRMPPKKQPNPKRPDQRKAAKVAKAARMIEAERLRKKRMEDLRIRNEEMQLNQSKEEQARAEAIAAKFETNTDELRLKRLEDRLTLLELLDKKRIAVINALESEIEKNNAAAAAALEEEKQNSEENNEIIPKSDDEESESSSDEEELDIVGESKPFKPLKPIHTHLPSQALNILKQVRFPPSSHQVFSKRTQSNPFQSPTQIFKTALASPTKAMGNRDNLREALKEKQRKQGNLWLARELGYKTEEEHLKECQLAAEEKRALVRKMEEARIEANDRRLLRERILLQEDALSPDDDDVEVDEVDSADQENEEDEEIQMARELEEAEGMGEIPMEENHQAEFSMKDVTGTYSHSFAVVNEASDGKETARSEVSRSDEAESHPLGCSIEHESDDETEEWKTQENNRSKLANPVVNDEGGADSTKESEKAITSASSHEENLKQKMLADEDPEVTFKPDDNDDDDDDVFIGDDEDDGEKEFGEEEPKKDSHRPRNAAWQAMLRKEAEKLKKQKMKRRQGLVEDQAEEEEEEEVAGLEDFGFSIKKKKQEDDDEEEHDDKLDEEDLKHVVDEVSDNEGDEEAGEVARKRQERLDEKEHHKEIMRRMREGYDGRRGGIAGGGVGARGIHRFDQLVAADNREDAKRLGLLNDDEMESEDEAEKKDAKGDDNEDDEAAILDKMLKDRFLHRANVDLEENFSDDEEEEKEEVGNKETGEDSEAEEERTQERLAKRFAKRARMQRLEEEFAHSQEFSQQRLIDEDESMRQELSQMKVRAFCLHRVQLSIFLIFTLTPDQFILKEWSYSQTKCI